MAMSKVSVENLNISQQNFNFLNTLGSFQHAVKTAEPNAVKLTPSQSKTSAIIEDWQITNRYRRKPISQEEIDFINV